MEVGIVGCSNGQEREWAKVQLDLGYAFWELGVEPCYAPHLGFVEGSAFALAKERAKAVNDFLEDPMISLLFDISGGDVANEVLPFLDYEALMGSRKLFFGYSDLTVVLNAIYKMTGCPSVLYQVRNLVGREGEWHKAAFKDSLLPGGHPLTAESLFLGERGELFRFEYRFLQGQGMAGVVVGGNTRCLLKLAGTPYWPPLRGRILFLEAYGGEAPAIATYFAQLSQLGVFSEVAGILLGTFTHLERAEGEGAPYGLLRQYLPEYLPVAKTSQLGHGADSRALAIGAPLIL